MPRVLYNEGRVVGYSAYEIYTRQLKAVDPDATPASEKEWLASMLANGASMLLRIGSDNISSAHYRDIPFPSDSRLCAANTILASFFFGEGYIGSSSSDTDDIWASKVTDYGNLMSNTDDSSPSGETTHSSTIPAKSDVGLSQYVKNQLASYLKIIDGIIIQPGTWINNPNTPPTKDFQPTLSDYPMFRISFSDKVETPFYILLTGFTDKGVIAGVTGLNGSLNTSESQNGDFLGPAVFPWSAKVIFSITPAAMDLGGGGSSVDFTYTRRFNSDASAITVDSTPIVDYESGNPGKRDTSDVTKSLYGERYDDASINESVGVLDIDRSSASVMCAYSIKGKVTVDSVESGTIHLPPSLYGAILSDEGYKALYPLDIIAPDSLHLYQDCTDYSGKHMAKFVETRSSRGSNGARAFVRDASTYTISQYDTTVDEFVPVVDTETTSIFGALVSEQLTLPMFYVQGSLRNGLVQRWTGGDYATSGHVGGEEVADNDVNSTRSDPSLWSMWYIDATDDLVSEYSDYIRNDITLYDSSGHTSTVSGILGTDIMNGDKNIICAVGCLMYRRLVGRFTEKIKSECGIQNIYDSNGDPINAFANDGVLGSVTARYMFGQIDSANRQNYYAVVAPEKGTSKAGTYTYPVRSSDNFVNVADKNYQFDIYVHGNKWNIPHFENKLPSAFSRSTKYLGTWWNGGAVSQDHMTVGTYDTGWGYISIQDVTHPTALSAMVGKVSGQIYQENAMLPDPSVYELTMSELFGSSLDNSGILDEFKNITVKDFLQKSLYTDMGTGDLLPTSNKNIQMATTIYTNGRNESTGNYIFSDMVPILKLKLANSEATVGKSQVVNLPDDLRDQGADTSDPTATVISAGKKQSFVLSMADSTNTPYQLYGTAGDVSSSDPGKVTWHQMLEALAENKSINIIGDNNYIEFNVSSNPIRLYVSSTEPTGNIPEGSIGLGWGTGVHTYTGGAWSQ